MVRRYPRGQEIQSPTETTLSGQVGVSRLRLLAAIEPRRLPKFLARANRVTLRQLKRELKLREKHLVLRDQLEREREAQARFALRHRDVEMDVRPGPDHDRKDRPPVLVLADRFLDPLPGHDLDVSLTCILLQHGHLANELQHQLARPGLCTADEAATLIEGARMLATRHTGDPYDAGDPDDSDPDDSDPKADSSSDPQEAFQRDPAANPTLMRRLEVLTDLALLAACDDSVLVGPEVYPRGRQSLTLEGDFYRISFWAPDSVIQDLIRFLDNLHARTGPLPAWASLMILVRDAVDTWKQVDRKKKKPQWWRVFQRDEYRCQVPACSKRAHLEGHHIVFRSHGGSDDPSNVVAACARHHHQGVHDGHIRCAGNANRGLRWVLGVRAKNGGPFRVYQGDLRIQ